MATATPDVTEEIFALILDDDEPPCMNERCSNSARWACRCGTCGYDYQFCDQHRTMIDQAIRFGSVHCDVGNNGACAGVFPVPMPWRPI